MPMATERRLAAILFTDIVGSTAVTARSESAGLALRDRHRELVRSQVERYHGRLIEAVGDESLSPFESAVDAVHAALPRHRAARNGIFNLNAWHRAGRIWIPIALPLP